MRRERCSGECSRRVRSLHALTAFPGHRLFEGGLIPDMVLYLSYYYTSVVSSKLHSPFASRRVAHSVPSMTRSFRRVFRSFGPLSRGPTSSNH